MYVPPWNGVDERAFVSTPDMQRALNVLPGAAAGVKISRSPFSLGVYKVKRDSPLQTWTGGVVEPMQMYFVSRALARNRSLSGPPIDLYVFIRSLLRVAWRPARMWCDIQEQGCVE